MTKPSDQTPEEVASACRRILASADRHGDVSTADQIPGDTKLLGGRFIKADLARALNSIETAYGVTLPSPISPDMTVDDLVREVVATRIPEPIVLTVPVTSSITLARQNFPETNNR